MEDVNIVEHCGKPVTRVVYPQIKAVNSSRLTRSFTHYPPDNICNHMWGHFSWRVGHDMSVDDLVRMSKTCPFCEELCKEEDNVPQDIDSLTPFENGL